MQALRASLQQLNGLSVDFCHEMFAEMWMCEQYARAVVTSGPYHVCGLAMAACIAEELLESPSRQTPLLLQPRGKKGSAGMRQAAVSRVC